MASSPSIESSSLPHKQSLSVYQLIKKLAQQVKNEHSRAPNYIEQLKLDGGIVNIKQQDKRVYKIMHKIYN